MKYYDEEEIKRLNAAPWQVNLLKMNPAYLGWGPHEDYMCGESGWSGRQIYKTWKDFGPWGLNDLNECVNFYFSVRRDSEECDACGGNGYHPQAQRVVNSFYAHMNPQGEHWNDKITQDEFEALRGAGRLFNFNKNVTVEEVNAAQNMRGMSSHDGINRSILTKTRLKRLGIPEFCDKCEGYGHVFTAPNAHVSLTLWWLHPRKGCSRGIEVEKIEESEIPEILTF